MQYRKSLAKFKAVETALHEYHKSLEFGVALIVQAWESCNLNGRKRIPSPVAIWPGICLYLKEPELMDKTARALSAKRFEMVVRSVEEEVRACCARARAFAEDTELVAFLERVEPTRSDVKQVPVYAPTRRGADAPHVDSHWPGHSTWYTTAFHGFLVWERYLFERGMDCCLLNPKKYRYPDRMNEVRGVGGVVSAVA